MRLLLVIKYISATISVWQRFHWLLVAKRKTLWEPACCQKLFTNFMLLLPIQLMDLQTGAYYLVEIFKFTILISYGSQIFWSYRTQVAKVRNFPRSSLQNLTSSKWIESSKAISNLLLIISLIFHNMKLFHKLEFSILIDKTKSCLCSNLRIALKHHLKQFNFEVPKTYWHCSMNSRLIGILVFTTKHHSHTRNLRNKKFLFNTH